MPIQDYLAVGGWFLSFTRGTVILCLHRNSPKRKSVTKEDTLMSDYELLTIVLMMLGIIVPLIIKLIDTKK